MTKFRTVWDWRTWLGTIVFTLGMIGLPIVLLIRVHSMLATTPGADNFPYGISALFLVIFIIALCLAPLGYTCTSAEIRIVRLAKDIIIPLDTITSIEPATAEVFRSAIRVAGSGGAFGFYGKFSSPTMPSFSVYATSYDDLVLILRENAGPMVLSPHQRKRFIECVRAAMTG